MARAIFYADPCADSLREEVLRPMTAGGVGEEGRGLSRLVHDLANPLSAVLAETQLLLLDTTNLAPEVVASLKAIEEAALRMRVVLRRGVRKEAEFTPSRSLPRPPTSAYTLRVTMEILVQSAAVDAGPARP